MIAAHWAGVLRYQAFQFISLNSDDYFKEVAHLRSLLDEREMQIAILKKRLAECTAKPRYSVATKIFIMIYMAYFQVPVKRVEQLFGVARSTFYRWRLRVDNVDRSAFVPANKTPTDVVQLVWKLAADNLDAGRVLIANQLGRLGVFLSDSTVRNILKNTRPPKLTKGLDEKAKKYKPSAPIEAFYPNHVWSADLTVFDSWLYGRRYILVAIDHFSRKVVSVTPLDGPNAAWTIDALEEAFRKHGPPKHLITDQQSNFTCGAVHEFLKSWGIKQRFGAIGEHGSIAVTERVNRTLKYEWLFKARFIRNDRHLKRLCVEFEDWYNNWRPHMHLSGNCPSDYYQRDLPEPLPKDAKTVPTNIERKVFKDTRVVANRLKDAA